MPESLQTRLARWRFNLFPAYASTGAHLTYIAADFREIRLALPLSWRTRNYVGTIFGGSIYGAVDPIYMVMLIKCLGRGFLVWDKAASVRFKRPARSTLYARFVLDDEELLAIRGALARGPTVERHYRIELNDGEGVTHAIVEKTVHVRQRRPAATLVQT
jgi:hypothetical protein